MEQSCSTPREKLLCRRQRRTRARLGTSAEKRKFRKSTRARAESADGRVCRFCVDKSQLFADRGAKRTATRNTGERDKERGKENEGKRNKREMGEGREKIAASGSARCSWNNFDVCMDEGGTAAVFNLPQPLSLFRPGRAHRDFLLSRCEFGMQVSALGARVRKLSLNNESERQGARGGERG